MTLRTGRLVHADSEARQVLWEIDAPTGVRTLRWVASTQDHEQNPRGAVPGWEAGVHKGPAWHMSPVDVVGYRLRWFSLLCASLCVHLSLPCVWLL